MNIDEQMLNLDKIFRKASRKVTEKEFQFKAALLFSLPNKKRNFQKKMDIIDLLASLIETSMLQGNAKRCFRFLCIYIKFVDELIRDVNVETRQKLQLIER